MNEDNRVEVELDLNEHEIYQLAMEAHKRDITLNKNDRGYFAGSN